MFTNIRSRSLALAAVSVAVGLGSHQALATSQTGTAKAAIVQAIVLTEQTNLNFGFIVPGAGTGTLAVSPAGATTPTGLTLLNGAAAGAWQVQGTVNQPLVVTLDTSDLLTGPGPNMTVDTFAHDAPATFTSGTLVFHVGATLHVANATNQTQGPYSGTYTVIVNY